MRSDQGYVNESPHSTEEPSEAANHKCVGRILPLLPLLPPPATILKGLQIPGTIEVRRNRFPHPDLPTTVGFYSLTMPNWDWKEASIFKLQRKFEFTTGMDIIITKIRPKRTRSCNLSKFYPVAKQALNIQNKF